MTPKRLDGRPAPSRRRRVLFRILAFFLGLAAAILCAEIRLRLYLASLFRGRLEELSQEVPLESQRKLTLGDVVLPDSKPNIVYRLKPGVRGTLKGSPLRINSQGYVGYEIPENKPENAYRIVVLGDSNSFGWAVVYEMCYVSILQNSLQQLMDDGTRIEVLNTAVPGYNAAMEVETYFERAQKFKPDAVIIQYSLNDNVLPTFLQDHGYVTRLDRFYLFDPSVLSAFYGGFRTRLRMLRNEKDMIGSNEGPLSQDLSTVPERYRNIVGPRVTADAYARLAQDCRVRGIPLYCLIPPELMFEDEPTIAGDPRYREIRDICARNNITLIDPMDRVRRFIIVNGLTSQDMAINPPYDWHPNPMRHILIAKELLAALAEDMKDKHGISPQALDRAQAHLDMIVCLRLEEYLKFRSSWNQEKVWRATAEWETVDDFDRPTSYALLREQFESPPASRSAPPSLNTSSTRTPAPN